MVLLLRKSIKIEKMDSFDFVANYHKYLKEISQVIRPEFEPILDELDDIDPHNLIKPDAYFANQNAARGVVWGLFLKKAQKLRG
jgi:hypothetical protein